MMRSLYSGVSGLRSHQTKMDVIGNNIANVNTVGFKSSSVLFKDVLYQTTQSATGATTNSGGTNAKQIGLGANVATINVSQTSGSAQSTNNPYDLMINGSGFFIVNRGGVNYFTKVGAFQTDDAGNLVTGNGDLVMGWQVDPSNPSEIKRDTVSALKPESIENQTAEPEMTSQIHMDGNIAATDDALLTTDGVSTTVSIYDNLGYSYTVKFKITQDPSDTSLYNLEIDSIKDVNNVDILKNGYTATLGDSTIKFDKNSGSFVGLGGVDGNKSTLLSIVPNDATKGNVFSTINDLTGTTISVYDEVSGTEITGEVTADFVSDGKRYVRVNGTDYPVDAINQNSLDSGYIGINLDCSALTMYSTQGECDVETHRTIGGEGRKVGTLTDVTIDTNGKIYGVYDNGVNKLLGQIAVANFVNPAGLEAVGSNLYKETKASGEFDGIGEDISNSGDSMTQGVLEMSNVDLSQEFTEMIVTQRGFQANSRIITVSDTLIEELVNLKR